MHATQYTLRNVSPVIDRELRSRAKRTNRSLNDVLLEALSIGLGMSWTQDSESALPGLAAFDAMNTKQVTLDRAKSIKELYHEHLDEKYGL